MNKKNVTAGTIARTICLFVALANQIMTVTGHAVLPIEDEVITQMVLLGTTVATALAAWWKNNSFTEAAKRGDLIMSALKSKEAN